MSEVMGEGLGRGAPFKSFHFSDSWIGEKFFLLPKPAFPPPGKKKVRE